jgi:hypothetical protein
MVAPVSIAESTAGPNYAASSAESVLAIIGCAAGGTADTPTVCRNDRQPADTFTAGPLADFGKIIIGSGRQPAVLVRAATATPGAYGSIDDADFTGTAVAGVDAATVPYNAYEGYVIFVAGGDLGTSGITYYDSLSDGRTLSGLKALGVGTSILISEGNVEFTLDVPEAELVDLVVDIRAQVIAHFAMGAGTHNAADATSGAAIGAAPTTRALAITRINQIRAALLLHADNSPTVHNSDDTTSFASLPAAATDGPTAVALANAIAAAYAVHAANAVAHDAADATNVITEADATPGTVEAGDILRVLTTAPLFDATTLAAALASLPTYQGLSFGGVCIAGPITTSQMWTSLINALDDLEAQQRPCSFLIEWRLPNDGETETQYRAAFEALWDSLRDNRGCVAAGDGLYYPTKVKQTSQQFRRTCLALAAARHVALRYEQSHGLVDRGLVRPAGPTPATFGGPLDGYRIYNDDAVRVGHDEAVDPGLADLLALTTTSYPQEGSDAFLVEPKTRAPDGDTIYTMPIRRIVDVAKRLIYFRLTRQCQTMVLREPGTTMMSEDAKNTLDKKVFADLSNELTGRVSSVTFEVDRVGTDVSVTSPRVLWNSSIDTGGYLAGFDGTVAVNQR